jgi:cobalamin biosynthesis protein CobD/CbiB
MVWLFIIAVLSMQYFLNMRSVRFQFNWAQPYVNSCRQRLSNRFDIGLLTGYCYLFFLAALVGTVCLVLFKFIFPAWLYSVLGGVMFWYAVDVAKLLDNNATFLTPELLLRYRIQHLFAPVFFYALFSSPLVLFYYIVFRELNACQAASTEDSFAARDPAAIFYWVNWIPVKLLGLAFAVVGHFKSVFTIWRTMFFSRSVPHAQNLSLLSQAAILPHQSSTKDVLQDDFIPDGMDVALTNELCEHAIVVWLLVIFVVCVGTWLG